MSLLRTLRTPLRLAVQQQQRASLSTLSPTLYTATSTTSGSRAAGHSKTESGNVELKMQMPKEMGGSVHKTGVSDPEQLFGMAYSTCFLSALNAVHSAQNPSLSPLPKSTSVRAHISIGKDATSQVEGFLLAIRLEILSAPLKEVGLDHGAIKDLVQSAHEMCPYSRAVKGNVEVEVAVVDA